MMYFFYSYWTFYDCIECDMHTFASYFIEYAKNLSFSIYVYVIIIRSRDFVNFESKIET